MKIDQLEHKINAIYDSAVAFRRELHMYPEQGGCEIRTSKRILEELKSAGFKCSELTTGIAGTGIVATVEGSNNGPVIMYRADMDALRNCTDLSGAEYASKNAGICHACGHDVHTAVALGLAKIMLQCKNELHGTVKIFFQPSEELPIKENDCENEFDCYTEMPYGKRAAEKAVEEGLLTNGKPVDRLLGMHCWPVLDAGKVGYEKSVAMAGTGNFHIAILGSSGHAGMPQNAVDAIVMAAQAISVLQTVVSRTIPPYVPIVLNIGTIRGGSRRSTVAGKVDITGTVRCADMEYLEHKVPDSMRKILNGVCSSLGGSCEFDYKVDLPPVINDTQVLALDVSALRMAIGENVVELDECPMTAEDFAVLSQRLPAVFLKLGTHDDSGKTGYPLHSGYFDINEKCIFTGLIAAGTVVLEYLNALD